MAETLKSTRRIVRVGGKLKELVVVKDKEGKVLQKIMAPVMLEFYPRDAVQIMVGAAILAIPVGFTQEAWDLGGSLPLANILALMALSLAFISIFVYYNYYRKDLASHWASFLKRVSSTYLLSLLVVACFLTIIQLAPWGADNLLAFKRMVLVSFPASMSAAVADIIK